MEYFHERLSGHVLSDVTKKKFENQITCGNISDLGLKPMPHTIAVLIDLAVIYLIYSFVHWVLSIIYKLCVGCLCHVATTTWMVLTRSTL